MAALFGDIRFYIYFIYGVSFLAMAVLVIAGITRATSYTLVSSFWLLAAFGLTHGITEIVDWIRFIEQTSSYSANVGLLYTSKIFLIFSFVLLLQFGINVLTYKNSQSKRPRAIPTILVVVYFAALYFFKISDISQAGLIARYSFGFIGAALSAISLIPLINTMKPLGNKKLNRGLIILAVGLAAYAICGGLIVSPIFGFPIQLFRAICAFSIAVASVSILEIFKINQ
jgi:two-component system, OmpR family, phosphate regulon sensor histidine kinase PhoR